MIASIQTALDNFKDEIDSILRQIEIVDFLCGIGATPSGVKISKTQSANLTIIQKSCAKHMNATTRNSIANGAVILISSLFEEFVRRSVAGGADHLKSRKKKFSDLSKAVQNAHLREFSELLIEQMRQNQIYSAEMVREIANLDKCVTGDQTFAILSERIAKNRRNVTSVELGEIRSRIGLKKILERMAGQLELQNYFGQYNVAVAVGKTAEKLNNYMQQRNHITHGGSSKNSYGTPWIRDHLQFFDILSKLFARELDRYVV